MDITMIWLAISACCNIWQVFIFCFFWLGYLNMFKELKALRKYKEEH